jgi:glycosyltransferase involved in cell wall biosynthesis
MGGMIYIINIIKTLDFLDDENKPDIFLFYRPELKKYADDINYPYISKIEWQFPSILKGNIFSMIIRKNLFISDILSKYQLDTIYPIHDFPVRTHTRVRLISWCADLQHKHYPGFFSTIDKLNRNIRIRLGLRNNDTMILSSNDVLNDFRKFYRIRNNLKIHIFHFVTVLEDFSSLNIEDLKRKYNLPDDYFMISNQFHKHKNHRVVLIALDKLKRSGKRVHLAFTGKFPRAKKSPYLAELQRIINENDLNDQISFLGVIPRDEQLLIMRNSQAVLQPSLFEGWSTVIEDAKSLQVPVIASNLTVNVEQLQDAGVYFDPHNPDELASILATYPKRNLRETFYEDYNVRVKKAAEVLLDIFKS